MRNLMTMGVLVMTGCGPLTMPMVPRLEPEQQREVDEAWSNMLTPPERLDRDLLLDVLVEYGFYQIGVDRLLMTSEKKVGTMRAKMTVRFDRKHPERDVFEFELLNRWGFRIRRERFTRRDVESRQDLIGAKAEAPSTAPAIEEWKLEHVRRMRRIEAATQPAGRLSDRQNPAS